MQLLRAVLTLALLVGVTSDLQAQSSKEKKKKAAAKKKPSAKVAADKPKRAGEGSGEWIARDTVKMDPEPYYDPNRVAKIGEVIPDVVKPEPVKSIGEVLVYPDLAKRSGVEGTVEIAALVDQDGKLLEVKVIKSSSYLLDRSAIDAINKVGFKPAMLYGKPLKMWYQVPIHYRLNY